MSKLIKLITILCMALTAVGTQAAEFPSKPIRLLVPYPPGGGTDVLARLISTKLSMKWNQSVVVENRPGGNGIISTNAVARATPDGYTIGFIISTHVTNPLINKSLPYNTEKDFAPVIHVTNVPGLFAINKNVPARTLSEFIQLAKSEPGKLNYGSPGTSTSGHLATELFKQKAGVNIMHIPYQGGAPASVALLQNAVQMVIGGPPPLLPHVSTGELKILGVSSEKRSTVLPNIPTMAEQGLTGFDMFEWYGIVAPAATPRPIVDKLNLAIGDILQDPDVSRVLKEQAADVVGGTPDEFAEFISAEAKKYKEIVETTNFTGR